MTRIVKELICFRYLSLTILNMYLFYRSNKGAYNNNRRHELQHCHHVWRSMKGRLLQQAHVCRLLHWLKVCIIGVRRLANAKIQWQTGRIIGHVQTYDQLITQMTKRIWVRSLRSVLCSDWLAFVWLLEKMKVSNVLRRSALFKPNQWNLSYVLYWFPAALIKVNKK